MIKQFLIACLLPVSNFVFSQVNHWETIVFGTDEWQYFIGNREPAAEWPTPEFAAGGWLSGDGPIGYGDGDDQTVIPPTYAVYLRKKFTIVDKSAIETMIFQADYDDGFVAYLNGVEIGRANIEGNPPLYDTDTNTDHEATLYSIGQVESTILDAALVEELLREGENTLAVQVHNRFGPESSDMTANFYLTLGLNNDTRNYRSTPNWFVEPFENSTLPIVKITTNFTINRVQRINGTLEIVNNESGMNSFFDEGNEYTGSIAVKFRGQSSLGFPKKNYSFETRDAAGEDLDTTFLNFPPEEDWVLHGPFSDKSLMRNVLTMELARRMGQYASKTQYVELYVNGDYQGIYVLMENIKRGEGRVDIARLRDEDIEGDELTGGYIYKIDKDAADWFSNFGVQNNANRKLEYQLVYPDIDKVQPEQFAYIQSYVDSFERAMRNPNLQYGGKSYDEYIDLKSFAEAHLLNELGRNVDGYRLSSYFHKQKDSDGGKIFAGPVWDFNLAYRNADYCNGDATVGLIYYRFCDNNYPFWWDKLFKTEEFTNLTKCRWEELRRGPFHTDSIFAFIDEQVEYLQPALSRNFQKWNIFGRYVWPNPRPLANSYSEEIQLMKNWIERRLNWMDTGVLGDCVIVSTEEVDVEKLFQISPNPASRQLNVQLSDNLRNKEVEIYLSNSLGQQVHQIIVSDNIMLNINDLPKGIYLLNVSVDGQWWSEKVIIQ